MSLTLARLVRSAKRKKSLKNDDQRLAWLNARLFPECDGISTGTPEDLHALMTSLVADRAPSETLIDAWENAARALVNALADPDDYLFGIAFALNAWSAGLRYGDVDRMARFVRGMAEQCADVQFVNPSEHAFETFECMGNRLAHLESALEQELPNGDSFEEFHWRDPSTVTFAASLLARTIVNRSRRLAEAGTEMSDEEVGALANAGGQYLWAAFHARARHINDAELRRFIDEFNETWFEMFESLVGRDALFPGALKALSDMDDDVNANALVEDGPELVATWRSQGLIDPTLPQYLKNCLTAASDC